MTTVKKHKNARGEWTACNATVRACRYGGADAHKTFNVGESNTPAFENAEQVFAAVDKKNTTVQNETTDDEQSQAVTDEQDNGVRKITVPSYNLAEAERRIEKANRKLERLGIAGRYEWDVESVQREDPETGYLHQFYTLTIRKPELTENGWTFVGRIDEVNEGDGSSYRVANSVNGQEIGAEFVNREATCDQCGRVRGRHKTYILRDKNGNTKQVGSSCLEGFLGVKPRGLWALSDDAINSDFNNERYTYASNGFDQANLLVNVRDVVAMALAVSDNGDSYVGANGYDGRTSTRNAVFSYMMDRNRQVDYRDFKEKADQILSEASFDDSSDYGRNMNTLLTRDYVDSKHVGFVVSVIPAWFRQTQQARQRAARPAPAVGYLGEKKEKIVNVEVTLERKVAITSDYGYRSIPGWMFVGRTSDNKLVKWSTTSMDPVLDQVKKGERVSLEHLTVKDHSSYNGEDQTVATRVKLRRLQTSNDK